MALENPPFDDDTDSILNPPTSTTRIAIITLNLYAGDRAFDFELQRAPGTSPEFETIAVLRGYLFSILKKRFTYIDLDLPSGVGMFRYRGRHTRNDALPSVYSTPVFAFPTIIDTVISEAFTMTNEDTYNPDSGELIFGNYTSGGADGKFFE